MSYSEEISAHEALEQITAEDLAIFFHNLGEIARLATRAECVEFGELTADARLMRRLQQWRGSSLQQGFPIAKQLAGWDFSTRVTP